MIQKIIYTILISHILGFGFQYQTNPRDKNKYQPINSFKTERIKMVKEQIQYRGINDKKILDAFIKVERHKFVPEENRKFAYKDYPLSIGYGQTISQPYVVAYMTDILDLNKIDKILEVGTGSGYQAAILAQICDTVYSVEILESLANKAKLLFNKLAYKNIQVKIGDGYLGWREYAPFDAIIVTCAPSKIPEPLKKQLAEGGRIIIPVGEKNFQTLVLMQKKKGKLVQKKVLPVRFVPMINKEGNRY